MKCPQFCNSGSSVHTFLCIFGRGCNFCRNSGRSARREFTVTSFFFDFFCLLLQYSLSSSLESSQTSSAIPLAEPQRVPPAQPSPPPVADPRDTAAYKAALELELWKEQQEELFQAQVKQNFIQLLIQLGCLSGDQGGLTKTFSEETLANIFSE